MHTRNSFVALAALVVLSLTNAAFGQGWPLPADTPNTPVPSPGVAPTVGWNDPISGFAGRFLDSNATGDYQQTFRTARAFDAYIGRDTNRVYLFIGSAIGVYNLNTFFTRLEARESLMRSTQVSVSPGNSRPSDPEVFLRWDKWVYPENTNSGWTTTVVDGQQKLAGFDWDDRGYIYAAYPGLAGWGIVKDDFTDDGRILRAILQRCSKCTGGIPSGEVSSPEMINVFKTSTNDYYLFVEGSGSKLQNVWKVNDPAHPVRMPDFGKRFIYVVKSGDRVAFLGNEATDPNYVPKRLYIYSTDAMIAGLSPMVSVDAPAGSQLMNVTTDGTNFYVAATAQGGFRMIRYAPNASRTAYTADIDQLIPSVNGFEPWVIRYNDGYIGVLGTDLKLGADGMLLRVTNSGFTDLPLNHYINYYYVSAPTGYSATPKSFQGAGPKSITPFKQNGKLYLIISAFGTGDVYRIRTDDDISVTLQGDAGTRNLNAPARTGSTLFYGDRVRLTSQTSATTPKTIQWNFGNTEAAAGADPNTISNSMTGVAVDHQYSGLTPSALGDSKSFLVTVTDSSSTSAKTTVTLRKPVARFGVGNGATSYQYLFTQADASAAAPIVFGDAFYDASDGDVEGHYVSWTLDGTTTNTFPYSNSVDYKQPVGSCGTHTLAFAAHYGPYENFVTKGPDFPLGFTTTYAVRPFAAAINSSRVATSSAITFSSLSRITADPTLVSALGTVSWQWDIVNSSDQAVGTPLAGTGFPIGAYTVPKSVFSQPNLRARLTITSAALTGACAGMETSKAYTEALNGPDPGPISGSCPSGGPSCSFAVTSATGASTSGWTYSWSAINKSTGATVLAVTTPTFAPTFTLVGDYTIRVTVTNDIGTSTKETTASITQASLCSPLNSSAVSVVYYGLSSGCASNKTNVSCNAGETISFLAQASVGQYDFGCAPHTFSYDFGDGSAADNRTAPETVTHTYSTVGSKTVTVTINNGSTTLALPITFNVSGTVITPPTPPTPPTPTPGSCPTLNTNSAYIAFNNNANTCSSNNGQPCPTGDTINFAAYNAGSYDFSCGGTHTFAWSFGDGGTGSGQNATHVYGTAGTYAVRVVITPPGKAGVQFSTNVTVSGAGTPQPQPPQPPPGCGTMTNSNVYVAFQSASGACSSAKTDACPANEAISFVTQANGYDFSCSTHTFSWNFGDNGTASQKDTTHTFATSGIFPVKLTIFNGSQTFTVTTNVTVTGGVPATPTATVDFDHDSFGSTNMIRFTPSVTPSSTQVAQWLWDFGDGTPSLPNTATSTPGNPTVLHVYTKPGVYTVILTARASSGATIATKTRSITIVVPRPRAAPH